MEETVDFKVLVDKLSSELGERILATMNLKEFMGYLISLVFDILKK